jgi:large subunit ribosomal protein L17
MRHLYDKVHLGRSRSHRRALFGNLSASLFLHKRIVTTLAKAKYARRYAERMITFARKGDLSARRQVMRFVPSEEAVKKLFDQLGPHFKNRNGGYTRIIKLGPRQGDSAPMALLELVGFDDLSAEAATEAKEAKKETKSRLKAAQTKAKASEKEKAEKKAARPKKEKKAAPVKKTAVKPEEEKVAAEPAPAVEE